MNVTEKNGEVIVKFNPLFYTQDTIKKAAKEFKAICKTEVKAQEEIIVKLTPKDKIKDLGYEFANHVLALMKNEGV